MKKSLLTIIGILFLSSHVGAYELTPEDAYSTVNITNKIQELIDNKGIQYAPKVIKHIIDLRNEYQDNQRINKLLTIILDNLKDDNSLNIQDQIIQELDNMEFPNFEFLYSPETIKHSSFVLDKLLTLKRDQYNKLISKPIEQVEWDDLYALHQDDKLSYLYSLLNNLNNVKGNDEIRFLIQMFQDKISEFSNELAYSKKLFEIYKHILANGGLDKQQIRILERDIKDYELSGIGLPEDQINQLKQINQKLIKLHFDFGELLLQSQKNYSIYIDNLELIKEIPQDILQIAHENAIAQNKEGYLFNFNNADYLITYCSDSAIRKQVREDYKSFAYGGDFDTREIILQILQLRQELAKILSYDNYGQVSLSNKMAPSPEFVMNQENLIREKAQNKADLEIQEIKDYFNLDNVDVWDHGYYVRLLKKNKYDFDNNLLRDYFEYDAVIQGLFHIANKLYGLEFTRMPSTMYDEQVSVYKVYKGENFKGYYVLDSFYNPDKSSGAWADILRSKQMIDGNQRYPIVINVLNITKGKDKTLLYHQEVATLFHEFGHAIHALLSDSNYSQLNGFYVEWDFVELPSQLMENWAYGSGLQTFAVHNETGQPLPVELINKIEKLKTFSSGIMTITQLIYSRIDMLLHTQEFKSIKELDLLNDSVISQVGYFKNDTNNHFYSSFSHIFNGGYAAGYYSYLWAEIIEADIYAQFVKNGIFDKDTAEKYYDTILSKGSIKPAIDMFRDFMGRDIQLDGFYLKKGF